MYVGEINGVGYTLAIGALRTLSFIYDIITFPLYVIIQNPWRVRQLSRRIKAKPIAQDEKSITYQSADGPLKYHAIMNQQNIDTMAKLFEYCSRTYPNKRCLGTRQILSEEDEVQANGRVFKKFNLGEYKWLTFAEVDMLALNFGRGLRELGNQPGKNMVIFAETRADWMIAAQALFKQSIPLVTIYATLGDDAIAHGINETEVTTVITSYDLLPKFKKILTMTPKVKTLIYMEDQLKKLESKDGYKEGVDIIKFSDVLSLGANSDIEPTPPKADDVIIIMYTSGSTGVPKGVLILHKNLIASLKGFSDATPTVYETDVMMAFLPLAHVYELVLESICLITGIPIGYSGALTMLDSSSKIKKGTKGDATLLHPTVITVVPLILDRITKSIQENLSKASDLKKILFKFAYDYKCSWTRHGYSTPLFDRLLFSQIRKLLGGRLRMIICGGAPLSAETHEQISNCLCATIIPGYGLTETTSLACIADYRDLKFGRVGPTRTVCEIKLVDWDEGNYRVTDKPYPRGEIVVGGDNISPGYYKNSEKTEEDFYDADGKRWFRTGDIGEVHEDGVLKIIDRKKDLVKLQAGEYVSLGKVEAELKTSPLVDNICVYGHSSKDYCIALIVPNQQQLQEFASNRGIRNKTFEELCADPIVEKAVKQELEEHGKKCKLVKFEIPGAIKLVKEVWSPDMGLVTAAFKLKRKEIQTFYQKDINKMYS